MADIVLFHHAGGLTRGVIAFADRLRAAGHSVETPDVFGGYTFDDIEDGMRYAGELGDEELAERAFEAVSTLPAGLVYVGMSLGCALAAQVLLTRGDAQGAVFLYGAVAPGWFGEDWPDGVPAQSHQTEYDPRREVEVDTAMEYEIPGAEMYLYPGSGHLFAEAGHEDYDPEAAQLALNRILRFLEAIA
ncbi:dienelactone hydrolase family protein [Gryllotalpicola sp.]|uniref:dienelactone hydrolase family protein n=1 Tax=Gryllotalpicola sp. TaxID=1932787 RepID=UPI0026296DE9|nr:dienelactone hydrolase family protein [Gryllotalpicola sp.]